MFTGIIEETGSIVGSSASPKGAIIEVSANKILTDAQIGDSIAVNGVCLTITRLGSNNFSADVSEETMKRTTLKHAKPGKRINLERALLPTTRLGGHIVQGHVDAEGKFAGVKTEGDNRIVRIEYPSYLARYIVEKGSITVDGISLTVANVTQSFFEIAIIPHTWQVTNLSSLQSGSSVNLEVDIVAKYVERMMSMKSGESEMTLNKLADLGY